MVRHCLWKMNATPGACINETGLCSSAAVVPQSKSTETDRDVKLGGDISCFIMTCDIFGTGHSTGQTNILALLFIRKNQEP